MAVIAPHAFRIYRGDSWTREIQIYTDDARTIPFDLTGKVITGQARKNPDDSLWFNLNITVTDAVNGIFEINHTKTETTNLSSIETTGKYDIQIVDEADPENDTTTIMAGTITVTKDYTHA